MDDETTSLVGNNIYNSNFETFNSVLFKEDPTLTYSEAREKLKYNRFSSGLILLKNTVGIGLFTLHKPMLDVGVFWAFVLNVVVGAITTYGLTLLDEVSSKLEADNPHIDRVKSLKGNLFQ